MPHPFIDIHHLNDIHADRFHSASHSLIGTVNLPEIPAVRAEISALLDHVPPEPVEPQPRLNPLERLRNWVPRWFGWLRAMPLP